MREGGRLTLTSGRAHSIKVRNVVEGRDKPCVRPSLPPSSGSLASSGVLLMKRFIAQFLRPCAPDGGLLFLRCGSSTFNMI